MSAAPRRPMPTSNSGLVLTPNVEPIRTAPPVAEPTEPPAVPEATTPEAPQSVEDSADSTEETTVEKDAPAPSRRTSAKPPSKKKRAKAKPAPQDGAPEARQDSAGASGGDDTKGPEDRIRASNVQLPTSLYEQVEAKCVERKLTHGELILVAVESTYSRLEKLIHPNETIGGKLFAARASNSAPTSGSGFKTPMNYRLREGDFEILDRVTTEFSARSRNHLIVAALAGYLEQN